MYRRTRSVARNAVSIASTRRPNSSSAVARSSRPLCSQKRTKDSSWSTCARAPPPCHISIYPKSILKSTAGSWSTCARASGRATRRRARRPA